MLKVATLAPMPSAKVRIATTIKPGFLASVRQAKRTSRRNKPICHPPWCWIAREWVAVLLLHSDARRGSCVSRVAGVSSLLWAFSDDWCRANVWRWDGVPESDRLRRFQRPEACRPRRTMQVEETLATSAPEAFLTSHSTMPTDLPRLTTRP